MVSWPRLRERVGGEYVVSALGALYVTVALGRFVSVVTSGDPLAEGVLRFVQVGGPGLALLYAGFRLPGTELRPEAYPRIVAWCVGAAAVLLGVVGLLVLDPDVTVNHPLWSTVLAAAVGNLGGLAIGANEARAISRARDAEEHEQRLQRQNDRLESFASMLAHELRNPLTIAQIYLSQAADGDETAAEEVGTALDRIEEMIDVLLITARNTDSEIDWERVEIAEVAADAWADLQVERADLVVESGLTVRTDPVHLRHLLENLFRNAVEHGSTSPRSQAHQDAVEHGSTSHRPPADNAHQTESDAAHQKSSISEDAVEHGSTSHRPPADNVDERSSSGCETPSHNAVEHGGPGVTVRIGDLPSGFYVEDDGPGIPIEQREAVFDAGYTTDADGIGLGLTFVARLVETYDWDYAITESESGGARFEFTNVDTVAQKEKRTP